MTATDLSSRRNITRGKRSAISAENMTVSQLSILSMNGVEFGINISHNMKSMAPIPPPRVFQSFQFGLRDRSLLANIPWEAKCQVIIVIITKIGTFNLTKQKQLTSSIVALRWPYKQRHFTRILWILGSTEGAIAFSKWLHETCFFEVCNINTNQYSKL